MVLWGSHNKLVWLLRCVKFSFTLSPLIYTDSNSIGNEFDRYADRQVEGKTIGYNLRVHVIAQQLFAPGHVVAQRERAAQHIQLSVRR